MSRYVLSEYRLHPQYAPQQCKPAVDKSRRTPLPNNRTGLHNLRFIVLCAASAVTALLLATSHAGVRLSPARITQQFSYLRVLLSAAGG
jgi:hypothetical protein